MKKTYYDIEVDAGQGARIEVVGEGQDGWYEWRLVRDGREPVETEAGYGSPEVALRDALCFVYGIPTERLALKAQPTDTWAAVRKTDWVTDTTGLLLAREQRDGWIRQNAPLEDLAELEMAKRQRGPKP